mgnify:CR=1 FL=1
MRKTCIVVPCYNEAARLPTETLSAFLTERPNIRYVLVNDGSRDLTELRTLNDWVVIPRLLRARASPRSPTSADWRRSTRCCGRKSGWNPHVM